MSNEPTIVSATLREAGPDEIHIECRMSDGQKGAFVVVDGAFPELAEYICKTLQTTPSRETYQQQARSCKKQCYSIPEQERCSDCPSRLPQATRHLDAEEKTLPPIKSYLNMPYGREDPDLRVIGIKISMSDWNVWGGDKFTHLSGPIDWLRERIEGTLEKSNTGGQAIPTPAQDSRPAEDPLSYGTY